MNDDDLFVQASRDALEQRTQGLGSDTLQRLRQVRTRALDQSPRNWTGLLALGSSLAMAAIVSVLVIPGVVVETESERIQPLDDWELLASDQDLDFYAELEFYQWLDASDAET